MDQPPQFSQNQMPPPAPPPQQYYQPPQKKSPIIKIIIILLILLIMGGIASWVMGIFVTGKYFSFVADYAKNLPQQKEQINNLTENINKNIESAINQEQSASIIWKTYKNNMFGFQFDYPSDLGDVLDFSLSYPSKEKFGEGPVIVTQGGDLSFGVTVGKECMAESSNNAEVSNIVVDGISSKEYKFSDSRVIFVCSVKGNYVYELSFASMSGEGLISQENVATFEKIISSFKF